MMNNFFLFFFLIKMKNLFQDKGQEQSAIIMGIFVIIAAFCIYNLIVASQIVAKFNNGDENNKDGFNKQTFKNKFNIDISSVEKTYILYSALLMLSIFVVVFVGSQYLAVSDTVQQLSNEYALIFLLIVSIVFVSYSINSFRSSNKNEGDITKGIVTVSGFLLGFLILALGFLIYNVAKTSGALQNMKTRRNKKQLQMKKL